MHSDILVYFAAPLFNHQERQFSERLALELERCVSVFLPQRDGSLLVDMLAAGVPQFVAEHRVFEQDLDKRARRQETEIGLKRPTIRVAAPRGREDDINSTLGNVDIEVGFDGVPDHRSTEIGSQPRGGRAGSVFDAIAEREPNAKLWRSTRRRNTFSG
jgi:hypothetical protein